MVKVRDLERTVQSEHWLEVLVERFSADGRELIRRADKRATELYGDRSHPSGERWIDHARGVAGVLEALRMDAETLATALLLGVGRGSRANREALEQDFGSTVSSLVEGVVSVAPIQALRARAELAARSSEKAAQLEAIRKMLLAMAQDVRVVLIKLADQVQCLRYLAAQGARDVREQAARDTFDLLAPLANRLGVWRLKWELEDLAFRCQDSQTYKSIATKLDEKRVDREIYLKQVMVKLRTELTRHGIRGDISGRPKHIYSIWKKMQRKGVGFEELSDVRAVRVLVEDIKDCYSALGVVHNLWVPISGEFDDYIAKPKANDYRSLHTAVVGPDDKVLEVQIRTRDMHRHAELGVAAHWRYKEASRPDAGYDRKIVWLRQILEWRDELADATQLAESFRSELLEDSVYVLTPQGRVIGLPKGGTPVDFAYHVHSELGHRCRGAKADGQMVPLNFQLANGQVVEIVAAKEGGPSRDWLNPSLGFIRSNRARAKVRQWFNSQAQDEAVAQGRAAIEKELQRLGRTSMGLEVLAASLGYTSPQDLFAAYQRGELNTRELQAAIRGGPAVELAPPPAVRARPAATGVGGVLVVGVDKLLTVLAGCCKPVPPDSIVGFVSRGRGVTVHRSSCANLKRLPAERLIDAQWAINRPKQRFPVDLEIVATSRSELMRDVLEVISREKVPVTSSSSSTQGMNTRMVLTLEVDDAAQLARLLKAEGEISGVFAARRRGPDTANV